MIIRRGKRTTGARGRKSRGKRQLGKEKAKEKES